MPIILREDGEQFVIPSYRDILPVKKQLQLKRSILALSENYGPYISLLRKGEVYEIAFSKEAGYLLGESIWHQLGRPLDLIYCERIPGENEAIFIIIKAGSVYFDGKFSLDNIVEELIILQTQNHQYKVIVYGKVPINHQDHATITKSYEELSEPIFPRLQVNKAFQLQPVDVALKHAQIGQFPTQKALIVFTLMVIAMGLLFTSRTPQPGVTRAPVKDIYENYYTVLSSPSVEEQLTVCAKALLELSKLPGWQMDQIHYRDAILSANVTSLGNSVADLNEWAKANDYQVVLNQNGFSLEQRLKLSFRIKPKKIYYIKDVVATLIDRLQRVYPGNNFNIAEINHKIGYSSIDLSVHVEKINNLVLMLIAQQFVDLPTILNGAEFKINSDQSYTGNLNVQIVGD